MNPMIVETPRIWENDKIALELHVKVRASHHLLIVR